MGHMVRPVKGAARLTTATWQGTSSVLLPLLPLPRLAFLVAQSTFQRAPSTRRPSSFSQARSASRELHQGRRDGAGGGHEPARGRRSLHRQPAAHAGGGRGPPQVAVEGACILGWAGAGWGLGSLAQTAAAPGGAERWRGAASTRSAGRENRQRGPSPPLPSHAPGAGHTTRAVATHPHASM